jgi:aminoglycoside 3-N-acetyltransferase
MSPKAALIVTKADLKLAFSSLGLARGDAVVFHTSLSAFGYIDGGADALIDAILETVLPEGTALAPTLTYAREHGPEHPPVFDVRITPSVTGRTPEVFRKRPGAVRSLHPTHSLTAIGTRAVEYTRGHEDSASPCDAKSPFGTLARDPHGRILMLGVTLASCTFFHYCEETAAVPYQLQPRPTHVVMTDAQGGQIERDIYLHRWGDEKKDFTIPDAELLRLGIMKITRVGSGDVRLLDAPRTADFLIDNMRRNPHYLLA